MAYREVYRVQIVEVIRRWQLGESQRAIARATGLSRNTVERYVRAAVAAGVSQGGEPPGEEMLVGLVQKNQPGPAPGAVPGAVHQDEVTHCTTPCALSCAISSALRPASLSSSSLCWPSKGGARR